MFSEIEDPFRSAPHWHHDGLKCNRGEVHHTDLRLLQEDGIEEKPHSFSRSTCLTFDLIQGENLDTRLKVVSTFSSLFIMDSG